MIIAQKYVTHRWNGPRGHVLRSRNDSLHSCWLEKLRVIGKKNGQLMPT
jgi:hypothetical protein